MLTILHNLKIIQEAQLCKNNNSLPAQRPNVLVTQETHERTYTSADRSDGIYLSFPTASGDHSRHLVTGKRALLSLQDNG